MESPIYETFRCDELSIIENNSNLVSVESDIDLRSEQSLICYWTNGRHRQKDDGTDDRNCPVSASLDFKRFVAMISTEVTRKAT